MFDPKELIGTLAANAENRGARQALQGLQAAAQSPEGQRMAQQISRQTADAIERAAKAAQAGDQQRARAAVQEILRTQEGAALAAQLKKLLQK